MMCSGQADAIPERFSYQATLFEYCAATTRSMSPSPSMSAAMFAITPTEDAGKLSAGTKGIGFARAGRGTISARPSVTRARSRVTANRFGCLTWMIRSAFMASTSLFARASRHWNHDHRPVRVVALDLELAREVSRAVGHELHRQLHESERRDRDGGAGMWRRDGAAPEKRH